MDQAQNQEYQHEDAGGRGQLPPDVGAPEEQALGEKREGQE